MSSGSTPNQEPPTGTTITLVYEDDWWVAKDEETGVVSQGKSRQEALENLDEDLRATTAKASPRAMRTSVNWGSTQSATRLARLTTRRSSSSPIPRTRSYAPFSGMAVLKVMVNSGICERERTGGDHAILRWEPPENHDAKARTVPVPLHDELSEGTLQDIADQAGAKDLQKFKAWIDWNR